MKTQIWEADESHKAMNEEVQKASKTVKPVVSTDTSNTSSKTMTREQFNGLTAREQMDYCLNNGKIKG